MLFTCGREVQTEKKILRFRKYPDTCGRSFRCETVSGIVLCYSRQACCLLCCLCHINNGSHTYQFTFELLLLCFQMWLWFQIWTKIFTDRRIWPKKGTDLHTLIQLPSTLDLATVNLVVLTGVKICSGVRYNKWCAGLNVNKEVSFSKNSWTI